MSKLARCLAASLLLASSTVCAEQEWHDTVKAKAAEAAAKAKASAEAAIEEHGPGVKSFVSSQIGILEEEFAELQLERANKATRQAFIDTGITPFQNARWKEYRRQRFANHTKSAANQVLSNVLKLHDKNCISVLSVQPLSR